jgi:hypothetical protein
VDVRFLSTSGLGLSGVLIQVYCADRLREYIQLCFSGHTLLCKTNLSSGNAFTLMERFETIGYSKLESLMLHDMYEAITEANSWNTEDINTFLQYHDHTDESYMWCLTQLRFIQKHGFNVIGLLRGVNVGWTTLQGMMRVDSELRQDIQSLLLSERNVAVRRVLKSMLED